MDDGARCAITESDFVFAGMPCLVEYYFDAIDGQPVHIVVLLLVPDDDSCKHLELLAQLARQLQHDSFRHAIMSAENEESIAELFQLQASKP